MELRQKAGPRPPHESVAMIGSRNRLTDRDMRLMLVRCWCDASCSTASPETDGTGETGLAGRYSRSRLTRSAKCSSSASAACRKPFSVGGHQVHLVQSMLCHAMPLPYLLSPHVSASPAVSRQFGSAHTSFLLSLTIPASFDHPLSHHHGRRREH